MKKTLLAILMISGILVTACSKKDDGGGGVQATGPAIVNPGMWNANCAQCATSIPNATYMMSFSARSSIIESVPSFEFAGSTYISGAMPIGANYNTYSGQAVIRANMRIRQQKADFCNLPVGDYTGGSTGVGSYAAGRLSGFAMDLIQNGTGLRVQVGISQAAIYLDQSLPQSIDRALGGTMVILSINGQACNRTVTVY